MDTFEQLEQTKVCFIWLTVIILVAQKFVDALQGRLNVDNFVSILKEVEENLYTKNETNDLRIYQNLMDLQQSEVTVANESFNQALHGLHIFQTINFQTFIV